ncbi:MAG TPA: efflux RND transporter permease subunit [Pirellulales bacterium]|nr:efflux RND transporter permease subunit [Pirellulales bacterium]
MLARFFIDRPVLAWVISIVIILLGGIAAPLLPIAEYPEIAPPNVQVTAKYPGANAQVIADTVAAPIEQQVVGVEGMLYMSSNSNNDGSYTLDVTFALGTDVNMAQVLVQNRVAIAEPALPDVVRAIGVTVKKRSPDILLGVSLYSEDNPETGRPYYDQLYMSNYATIQLKDALARLEGVGDVTIFGQQDYSMRVWLDPDKLQSRNLTAGDVIRVLREQNVQVAAGQIGQPPVPRGQDFQYTMSTLGRLVDAEQFANIILTTGSDGEVTYLKDVARTELEAKSQDQIARLDGKPSAGLGIFQLPGSNALDTGDRIKTRMRELEARFPRGLHYAVVYDTTPFIRESVDEVFHTLRDSVILVALVILVFLQDWKSLLLPVIDMAVSLIGTFAVMKMMGFTLNNLTLFGLVLAIGLVVDDAIVVLENIERWLAKGLPVREATINAMSEITGPILAMTLVLSSVLLPSAFLGGITGQFFRQFALTISVSMLISAVNAMTMTPARAAWIFASRKPGEHGDQGKEALPWWFFGLLGGLATVWLLTSTVGVWLGLPAGAEGGEPAPGGMMATLLAWGVSLVLFLPGAVAGGALGWFLIRPVNWLLGRLFRGFNWVFERATRVYGKTVGWCLRLSAIVLLIYVGLIGLTGFGFTRVPSGFVPAQDKGYMLANIQLPDAASLERTVEVTQAVEKIALETPGVFHTLAIPGQSFVLNAFSSNYGSLFIILKPFHERRAAELTSEAILHRLRARLRSEVPEARVLVFGPPAVRGLGNAGGFKLMVEAIGDVNFYLQKQSSKVEQFRDLRQNPFSAFVLGAVLVFFVLAGLYESWSLPLAVVMVVPMCLLSALAGIAMRGMDVNIFVQIGFVVLVGLACKNAILIVEFARDRQQEGAKVFDAVVEAARVRLRPILMTSACFVHMVPPYFATGAGAEMRRSLGTAVLWGAFGVTLFGIFLTPVFFYVIRRLVGARSSKST